MKTSHLSFIAAIVIAGSPGILLGQVDTRWKQHDMNRPVPAVVNPGTSSTQAEPGRPPSDAIVLFDGKDLSKWQQDNGSPAKWKVENGYVEVVAKTGEMRTKEGFGDCQLHVELREPTPPHGESQERGNSGVFLMGLYEVQVLDSYHNRTYADGQAAAIYGQYPPLVIAARPPGEWQWYDIVFNRPHFDSAGKLLKPAHFTVFDNGVLVQDNVEPTGPTANGSRPPYKAGPDKLPLALQDHGNPVRYRNIWIRELK
ncbi:MAG: 3-keto-disaccharide hydrolase [Candidatus Acidiferrum sp.]